MTASDTRTQLHQKLDQLPPGILQTVVDFVDFLLQRQKQSTQPLEDSDSSFEQNNTAESNASFHNSSKVNDPNIRKGKGNILSITETWVGDDFDECLQSVYDTRSQIKA